MRKLILLLYFSITFFIAHSQVNHIVISQVYGGGGNSGATYKNDFIELFNPTSFAVSLSGWSVQYQNAAGTGTWLTTPLTGTIPAHGFYLIQEAQGSGGITNLPAPDNAGFIGLGATAGKVILSNSSTALSGANPFGNAVIDKVGYGSTASGFETAPAAAPDNTTALKRIANGADTDNNSTDFILALPEPVNSIYITTAPAIASLNPPDNSSELPYNTATAIVFDKPVQKGTGMITVYENGVALPSIDVTSSSVTIINDKTVSINITYLPGKSYYINIASGAFTDVYGNNFSGIGNPSAWNFLTYNSSIQVTIPVTFDFQRCTGTGLLPNGFTQFSKTGSIVWDCTPFGRAPSAPAGTVQSPSAIQINGFAGGTNVPNVDWLVSPSIDLTATNYPLLSFWSRTAFNGRPLQLKISTDYPGTGDPANYTWTDLNGKFPSQASNIWTLAANINLSAFRQSNVHFGFVYTSGADEGARWTVDDISLINSLTPPPPSLSVGTSNVQFSYVANGATNDKTFTFLGNDLTEDVTLGAAGAFLLSKDGISYSSSVSYAVAEANNLFQTVYARFAPTQAGQNFTGTVTVSTSGLVRAITLNGTSIDPATTLEVVNWNMDWFGSPTLGPANDDQQERNAETVLKKVGADIYGLVEVVDESRLARIVSHMPGYTYTIGHYGSHVNPPDPAGGPPGDAQKLAFVYKTSLFSNISARPLINNQNINSSSYTNWSSGRYPFLVKADVSLNGVTKTISFILQHAKANTSPTATSYARRQASAAELHDTLMTYFANENVLVLGDFNDDLDQSITAGFTTTSYSSFTSDPVNFFSPTLALSIAGKKSTVSYKDMIDHVVLSNELQPFYMPATATVLSDVSSWVSNYGSTTTDHYPVFTRYMFCKLTCPSNITVPNDTGQCGARVNFTVPATMTCGTVTAVPAPGSFFPIGTTTVHITAGTGDICSFAVTVTDKEAPVISSPGAITVSADAGACAAAKDNVHLGAPATGDNCPGVKLSNDAPAIFPAGTTIVTWTATDSAGNTATAAQTVTVADDQAPIITNCPSIPVQCYNSGGNYTIPAIGATDNCGSVNYSFVITGATSRSGSTSDASGRFNEGTSIITWTVTDTHNNSTSCQTTLTVNSPITSSVADVYAVNPGGDVNTLYTGYGPTSLTLMATVNGGTAPYSYKWTTVSSTGPALNNTAYYTVSPSATAIYYLTVMDAHGCSAALVTKRIHVTDIRCGNKLDKAMICKTGKDKSGTICVTQQDVATRLSNGAYLGTCSTTNLLHVSAAPNPSTSYFTISIEGGSVSEKVSLRATDISGRIVEYRNDLGTNSTLCIGTNYLPGFYIIEVMQGDEKRQIKLVKTSY